MRSRKPKPLDAAALLDYAVRVLSARALTQGELRLRLSARAAEPRDVDDVLARMKARGYLDDRRFAETFSRLRLENQGFGRHRVLRDLRGRCVAPALAEKAVAEAYRDVNEAELIDEYLKRKLRSESRKPPTPAKMASLYRMLLRAGFTSGKIIEALRKLSVPSEWVEGLETVAEEEAPD